MAKKTKPVSQPAAQTAVQGVVTETVVTRIVQPAMPDDPTAPVPVSLDLKVDVNNLAGILMVEMGEKLEQAMLVDEAAVDAAAKAYNATTAKLAALAEALLKSQAATPTATALAAALTAFYGQPYTAVIRGSAYGNSESVKVDIDKRVVAGYACVVQGKAEDADTRHSTTHHTEATIPFTPEMREAVTAIEAAAAKLAQAREHLAQTQRAIASLPSLSEKTRAVITRKYLEGALSDRRSILTAIDSVSLASFSPVFTRHQGLLPA